MDLAQSLTEDIWRMEVVNNDTYLLIVATSHKNITSISNTLVVQITLSLRNPSKLMHGPNTIVYRNFFGIVKDILGKKVWFESGSV